MQGALEGQKKGLEENQANSERRLGTEPRPDSLVQVDGRQPIHLVHLVHHQVQFRAQVGRAGARGRLVEEAVAPLRNEPQVRLQPLQILLHALREEGEERERKTQAGREKAGQPLAKEMGME